MPEAVCGDTVVGEATAGCKSSRDNNGGDFIVFGGNGGWGRGRYNSGSVLDPIFLTSQTCRSEKEGIAKESDVY